MTGCGIDGVTKTDGRHALTLPGLPEGELTFTLSESETPQPPKWSSLYIMPTEFIIVMAAVLAAAGISLVLRVFGAGEYYFYPALSDIPCGAADIAMYCAFAALSLLPSAVILYRNIAWIVRNNYGAPSKENNIG